MCDGCAESRRRAIDPRLPIGETSFHDRRNRRRILRRTGIRRLRSGARAAAGFRSCADALSRACPQVPPGAFRRPDRPGSDGAHADQRLRGRAHPAGLDADGRARRRQDHDRPHPGARAQLPDARRAGRADHGSQRIRRALPRDHRGAPYRRDGDRRRLQQRRGEHPPDQRRRALRTRVGATRSISSTRCTCSRPAPSTPS